MVGKPTSFKSRHINIRYYHAKEMVESGDIVFEYCPTELMRADVMTKAMGGADFKRQSAWLLNER